MMIRRVLCWNKDTLEKKRNKEGHVDDIENGVRRRSFAGSSSSRVSASFGSVVYVERQSRRETTKSRRKKTGEKEASESFFFLCAFFFRVSNVDFFFVYML